MSLTGDKKLPMQRRLRFGLVILISQMLLTALAFSWLVQMVTIAVSGSAYFVENNTFILWSEIIISVLITLFALLVIVMQIRRLNERRANERRDRQPTEIKSD
jgi:membrane protein implicated in regulation of membrane protease activity